MSSDAQVFRPYVENTAPARWITLGAVVIATTGTVASILSGAERGWVLSFLLLPLILGSGPAIWWLLYRLEQRAGVVVGVNALMVQQPIRYFSRVVPYEQIGACSVVNGTLAIIWLKGRPTAIGDEPRPPKIVLLRSIEVEAIQDCYAQVSAHLSPHPDWTAKDATIRISRRAVWRRVLFYTGVPIVGFLTILIMVRIVFSVLAL